MPPTLILIAEDDLTLLAALSLRLQSAGYDVVEAQDAVQAVSLARRKAPDLLLLDINMPAGGGFTILDRIRSIEDRPNVPVIFLTGERGRRVADAAQSCDAEAILYKPVENSQLLTAVAQAVGATDTAREQALDRLQLAANEHVRQG